MPVLVINPGININTGKVFANLQKYSKRSDNQKLKTKFNSVLDLISFLQNRENKLEEVALRVFPELMEFKQELLKVSDADLVRMTGTGSSYFCLFADEHKRDICADNLKQYFPNYFFHSGFCKDH